MFGAPRMPEKVRPTHYEQIFVSVILGSVPDVLQWSNSFLCGWLAQPVVPRPTRAQATRSPAGRQQKMDAGFLRF
ncbi:hypothetical protein AK812_SmicGene45852 [Symbiodinium microadriaticum]|uniref:Uncharacterized protein n=1 Tax=Symbiodinium microadriaticum TaxID=2951 RepID=A0A1Q9BV46_SYMMI|nr:hypothetical protein AK812_SmicGene45852 [Symbiodinium microadriaticum]